MRLKRRYRVLQEGKEVDQLTGEYSENVQASGEQEENVPVLRDHLARSAKEAQKNPIQEKTAVNLPRTPSVRGRPRKERAGPLNPPSHRGRPRKERTEAVKPPSVRGRPRKERKPTADLKAPSHRGRPRKERNDGKDVKGKEKEIVSNGPSSSQPKNSIEAAMLLVNFNMGANGNANDNQDDNRQQPANVQPPSLSMPQPGQTFSLPSGLHDVPPGKQVFFHPPQHIPHALPSLENLPVLPPGQYYYMIPQYYMMGPPPPPPDLYRTASPKNTAGYTGRPILKKHDPNSIQDPATEDQNSDPKTRPRRQNLRFKGDLYTPQWVRNDGMSKEGLCETCVPGKWLQLKNSAFWYHKQYLHGISSVTGREFKKPAETRWKGHDMVEGLCHQCKEWVLVSNVKKKTSLLWYRHAHKCHTYPKGEIPPAAKNKRGNGKGKRRV